MAAASLTSLPTKAEGPEKNIVKVISDYDNLRMYFKSKLIIVQRGATVTWVNEAGGRSQLPQLYRRISQGHEANEKPVRGEKGRMLIVHV